MASRGSFRFHQEAEELLRICYVPRPVFENAAEVRDYPFWGMTDLAREEGAKPVCGVPAGFDSLSDA